MVEGDVGVDVGDTQAHQTRAQQAQTMQMPVIIDPPAGGGGGGGGDRQRPSPSPPPPSRRNEDNQFPFQLQLHEYRHGHGVLDGANHLQNQDESGSELGCYNGRHNYTANDNDNDIIVPINRNSTGTVNQEARRSRFIEGNMNDSISKKPPSIFLRDHTTADNNNNNNQRNSGIFRFGKTIASAFNPFGGGSWGSVSDIWKGASGSVVVDGNHNNNNNDASQKDDPRVQAEKAYAELKKSGYKGTVKGSYMQNVNTDTDTDANAIAIANANSNLNLNVDVNVNMDVPNQTWKTIREKMEYGSAAANTRNINNADHDTLVFNNSYQPSTLLSQSQVGNPSVPRNREIAALPEHAPVRLERKASLRQDLRKAKSSFSIMKRQDAHTQSASRATTTEDSGTTPTINTAAATATPNAEDQVRKQKSRKDLIKQAKLLKQASNLEDKLERTRREIRDLGRLTESSVELRGTPLSPPPPPPSSSLVVSKSRTSGVNNYNNGGGGGGSRKFVPKCLPSLPSSSERASGLWAEESDTEDQTAQSAHAPRIVRSPEGMPTRSHVKRHVLRSRSGNSCKVPPVNSGNNNNINTTSADDGKEIDNNNKPFLHQTGLSSNKRKSPNFEKSPPPGNQSRTIYLVHANGQEQHRPRHHDHRHHPTTPISRTDQSRRTKLPKNKTEDSPGSVERKQQRQQQQSSDHRSHRQQRSRSPSSSASPSSSSSRRQLSTTIPTLRTRKDVSDLRSAGDTKCSDYYHNNSRKSSSRRVVSQHQSQQGQKHQHFNFPVVSRCEDRRKSIYAGIENTSGTVPESGYHCPFYFGFNGGQQQQQQQRQEDIPPVPPLPRNFAADSNFKVNVINNADDNATAANLNMHSEESQQNERREREFHANAKRACGFKLAQDKHQKFEWPGGFF